MRLRPSGRALLLALVATHEEDGRNRTALARQAGISKTYLSLLLGGHRESVSSDVATRLSEVFGVDPRRLFTS
jgi:plasmid maintenance system antidote protein VapI